MAVRSFQTLLTVCLFAIPTASLGSGDAVLESPALRLEVTASPYSYRLIEKATGQALVVQSATTFTVGATAFTATAATGLASDGVTLSGDLVLAGTGETGHVAFTFSSPEVLQVSLTHNQNVPVQVKEQFDDQQEHYYGIWEYPFGGNLDNRGNDAELLGVGQNTGSYYTSARAPFYVTSRRYGIYAQSTAQGHYTVAVGGKTSFSFRAPQLRYHVIYGPAPAQVLARYAAVAGGPFMPPTWAFDSIWWADDFHADLHNASNAQGNVLDLASQLQSRHLRASAVWIDRPYGTGLNGWGNMDFDAGFPNPPQLVSDLHARGLNLLLWIANRAWNTLYNEGTAQGFLFPGSSTLGPAADLRIPGAYSWMLGKLNTFVALGIKGYKIDRGEQGEHPDAVQNENVDLFAQVADEGLAAANGPDHLVFARNLHDTGRRHAAVWNGDSASSFTGLAYSVTAGLRSGALMMPMWGSDTGGYLRSSNAPSEELFARWLELSAFCPMMEVLVGGGHTPWYNYSSALVDIARNQTALHHDLIPYTRSFLRAATTSGAPVMRPLAFAYPDDAGVANRSDEYLYGSELLVAPVLAAGASSRSVYLPAGRWLDYRDLSTMYSGPQALSIGAPLASIPVLVREGGIVPRGDILRSNDNWTAGWAPVLHVELYPSTSQPSAFDYDTDSGVQTITMTPAAGDLSIAFPDLGTNGDLRIHLRPGFTGVTRNGVPLSAGTDYVYDSAARLLTVPFTGATTVVVQAASGPFAGYREGEDPANTRAGNAAVAACSACSGGSKITGLGPGGSLTVNGISGGAAGSYPLVISYLTKGSKTFFLSVNGGSARAVTVSGKSTTTPATTTITVDLIAGPNTLRFFNDSNAAPDLDRVVIP